MLKIKSIRIMVIYTLGISKYVLKINSANPIVPIITDITLLNRLYYYGFDYQITAEI